MGLIQKIIHGYNNLIAKQLRLPSGLLAKYVGNTMNKSNEILYQLILRNIYVKEGDSILEIGFGNGKFFPMLNAKANKLKIVGIDHSPEMVAEGIRNNLPLSQTGEIKLSIGSSQNISYPDNSFDHIICINVIYFWENPELDLKEILRVLKPGGYFYTGFRPKENLSKFQFSKFGFSLYTEEEWQGFLEKNGFRLLGLHNSKDFEDIIQQKENIFESVCIISTK